jgi:hypothetical protein
MKRVGVGLSAALICLGLPGLAFGAFKLGKYSGQTTQRCRSGAGCSPVGKALRISFSVRRARAKTMIVGMTWSEGKTCNLAPPHNHLTGKVGPIQVRVSKSGKFSYTNNSEQVIVHIQGRLSGKHASGTLNDSYTTQPGVTCKTGTVHWGASTT